MSETTVIHVRDYDSANPTIYIGRAVPSRGFKASTWANPFKIDSSMSREKSLAMYEERIRRLIATRAERYPIDALRGHALMCWCSPLACHGNVLVKILKEREVAS